MTHGHIECIMERQNNLCDIQETKIVPVRTRKSLDNYKHSDL